MDLALQIVFTAYVFIAGFAVARKAVRQSAALARVQQLELALRNTEDARAKEIQRLNDAGWPIEAHEGLSEIGDPRYVLRRLDQIEQEDTLTASENYIDAVLVDDVDRNLRVTVRWLLVFVLLGVVSVAFHHSAKFPITLHFQHLIPHISPLKSVQFWGAMVATFLSACLIWRATEREGRHLRRSSVDELLRSPSLIKTLTVARARRFDALILRDPGESDEKAGSEGLRAATADDRFLIRGREFLNMDGSGVLPNQLRTEARLSIRAAEDRVRIRTFDHAPYLRALLSIDLKVEATEQLIAQVKSPQRPPFIEEIASWLASENHRPLTYADLNFRGGSHMDSLISAIEGTAVAMAPTKNSAYLEAVRIVRRLRKRALGDDEGAPTPIPELKNSRNFVFDTPLFVDQYLAERFSVVDGTVIANLENPTHLLETAIARALRCHDIEVAYETFEVSSGSLGELAAAMQKALDAIDQDFGKLRVAEIPRADDSPSPHLVSCCFHAISHGSMTGVLTALVLLGERELAWNLSHHVTDAIKRVVPNPYSGEHRLRVGTVSEAEFLRHAWLMCYNLTFAIKNFMVFGAGKDGHGIVRKEFSPEDFSVARDFHHPDANSHRFPLYGALLVPAYTWYTLSKHILNAQWLSEVAEAKQFGRVSDFKEDRVWKSVEDICGRGPIIDNLLRAKNSFTALVALGTGRRL